MNPADLRAVIKPRVRWRQRSESLWRVWIHAARKPNESRREILVPLPYIEAETAVLRFLL